MAAEKLTNNEKAARVFDVLSQNHRPRLSLAQIAEEANLSVAQAQQGWTWLRRTMPELCIMEPHRQNTVYYLSDEFTDGARYILWQTRHMMTRMATDRHTVRQLSLLADVSTRRGRAIAKMAKLLDSVDLFMAELIQASAEEAGMTEEEVDKLLEAAA